MSTTTTIMDAPSGSTDKVTLQAEKVNCHSCTQVLTPEHVKSRTIGSIVIFGTATIFTVGGFFASLNKARRQDTEYFAKSFVRSKELPVTGAQLAYRALAWGTLLSFTGVGLICFGVCKLLGVHNVEEFQTRMGQILPRVPKREQHGRTEFKNLTDLLQYLIDLDKEETERKLRTKNTNNSTESDS